jgi:hypothetical protein
MDRENYEIPAADAADNFARELSDLGRKHGIGIAGPVQLFMLEHEDLAHDYAVDDESLMLLA